MKQEVNELGTVADYYVASHSRLASISPVTAGCNLTPNLTCIRVSVDLTYLLPSYLDPDGCLSNVQLPCVSAPV